MAKKDQPNKGWIKELKGSPRPAGKKSQFNYSNPVVTPTKVNSMALNSRLREHKTAASNPAVNIVSEQNQARKSKGK